MQSTDDDPIGVRFRFQDGLNYYRFSCGTQQRSRRLKKWGNGTFTTFAADTAAYVVGQSYNVTILAQETRLQIELNGLLVFSVTDSALNGGTPTLYNSYNSGSTIDNILVEDLKRAESWSRMTSTTVTQSAGLSSTMRAQSKARRRGQS